jgi:hypothetical protein
VRLILLLRLFSRLDQRGQQAIIGADKIMFAQARRQRASLRAHAGIDHIDVHAAGRKERGRAPKGVGAFLNVLRRNRMADVDDLYLRGNPIDHTFQDACKSAAKSEIGGEGNNSHFLLDSRNYKTFASWKAIKPMYTYAES